MFHKKRKKTVNRLIKPRTKTIRWIVFSVLFVLIGLGAWIGSTTFKSINKITADSGQSSLMSLFDGSKQLKGKTEGRTNILLLGNGGAEHGGSGGLTDTMIVLSIDWQSKKVAMLSIPRDLWVKVPVAGHSYSKINAVYSYAEDKKSVTGGGGKVVSKLVSDIFGVPIHYYLTMDFNGFRSMINTVGGIDIYVDKAIYDPYYPADNMIDYAPFKIGVGMHHMDGVLALKYARSRYTTSDFDRSRRQQQVLSALKEKMVSMETMSNPKKVTDIITVLGNHLRTNLSVSEIQTLSNEIKTIDTTNMINKVLSNETGGPLVHPEEDERGWILIPKLGIGIYTDLQTIAKNIFNVEVEPKPELKIEVLNGTGKAGVAAQVTQLLKTYGYNVAKVGNATVTSVTQTIIYNCAGVSADATIKSITGVLSAVTKPKTGCGNIDIQILVGESSL